MRIAERLKLIQGKTAYFGICHTLNGINRLPAPKKGFKITGPPSGLAKLQHMWLIIFIWQIGH